MDKDLDAILPYWWLQEHRPSGFFDGPEHVRFTSRHCKENCTSLNILGKATLATLSKSTEIPLEYRGLVPLQPKDPSKRLQAMGPCHRPCAGCEAVMGTPVRLKRQGAQISQKMAGTLEEKKIRPSKAPCPSFHGR